MAGLDLRRRDLLVLALLGVGLLWGPGARGKPRLAAGGQLGEVKVALAGGGTFSLAELRGQVVVVNFWASWCQRCFKEAPVLSRLQRTGVKVVGLAVDRLPLVAIERKARETGMQYQVGVDATLAARLGIYSVPTTCVVGTDGALVELISGHASDEELAEAVAKAQAGRLSPHAAGHLPGKL